MRRKPGALVALEVDICTCAAEMYRAGEKEFYGYEIAKKLAALADRRSLAAYGTLYRALARLQDMGLLDSRWENPLIAARENRPLRRLYALTRKGHVAAVEAHNAALGRALTRARKGWVTS
jgi:DNA-binding PadR family transcriptional regulator